MKKINAFAAALCCSLLMAGAAHASSFVELGEDAATQSPSIITLGDPCTDASCAEEETAVANTDTESSDSNAALVDAYGMPTNMPVIMRPSMDTPDTSTAAAPAAAPAATPTPAAAQPQTETKAPVPQPEQPKPEQPQPEGQQPPVPPQPEEG